MTDEIYIALEKGTDFPAGQMFVRAKKPNGDNLFDGLDGDLYFKPVGHKTAPIFHASFLRGSSNFKLEITFQPNDDVSKKFKEYIGMTDKEDQTSSEKPSPKYRALRDGTGYQEGDILIELDSEIIEAGEEFRQKPYGIDGLWVPLFSRLILEESPDFELVVNYWEPKDGEPYYSISGLSTWCRAVVSSSDNHQAGIGIFRCEKDVKNLLGEIEDLINTRSKESRKL